MNLRDAVACAVCGLALAIGCIQNETVTCEPEQPLPPSGTAHERDELAETVGMVSDDTPHVLCSGVWVAERMLLTAGHCDAARLWIGVGARAEGAVWLAVTAKVRHPTLDVLLLQLASAPPPHLIVACAQGGIEGTETSAVMLGFGRQGNAEGGALKVLEVAITFDDSDCQVISDASHAPCAGDSGAPLFVQGPSGAWSLSAMLTAGSLRCDGHDHALPASGFSPWLAQQVKASACADAS